MKKQLKIALLCGGPSLERGISLNSARSVCDHLQSDTIEIVPIYFDHKRNPYLISRGQLYSNTPSDFDFKLASTAKPLTKQGFCKIIRSVDLAFPVMHGRFGEDGQIQKILETHGCPYIGAPTEACRKAFDKFEANELIRKHGFFAPPSIAVEKKQKNIAASIQQFFKKHKLKKAIVKPATGGSSIAVYAVATARDAIKQACSIMEQGVDSRVVIEPFCDGIEFTVIILENRFSLPVAVMPTEIELDYQDYQIFDFRKKYLATRQVTYHCPPRFDDAVIERIQIQAEQLFSLLGLRDFGRFDGWLLPDGNIWFSDFNPISGMEQNSFLFMQAAQIGMTHRDVLQHIVKSAARRNNIPFPESSGKSPTKRTDVSVIFGGNTAERQVSLMSGTNVWLKLRQSSQYNPIPFLLDTSHYVWKLPYAYALNHTVEEIMAKCESATRDYTRLRRLLARVTFKLGAKDGEISQVPELPVRMTLDDFINSSEQVFLGLHGGIGEDGRIQDKLEQRQIPFNGSSSEGAAIAMDKYLTGEIVTSLGNPHISTAKKQKYPIKNFTNFQKADFRTLWTELTRTLESETIIVKPLGDGCSAGVARLFTATDIETYCQCALKKLPSIPPHTLTEQDGIIEMPPEGIEQLLFEQFVVTDHFSVHGAKLKRTKRSGWIEVTVGVIEKSGKLHAMNPSLTVASGNVLSLEEKFQGGTGVNITPPPPEVVPPSALKKARKHIEKVAAALKISGYARIDAFLECETGDIIVIEANTLPGLTPSTVIFHQALAEKPPMYPTEFLETITARPR